MFKVESPTEGFKINQEAMGNLKDDLLAITVIAIKERLTKDVVDTLTPKNFFGEASEYLADHSIPQDDDMLLAYATKILDEFKENLDSLIVYDKTTHKITIHQSIADFEFGTYYKPLLKLITKSIELSLKGNLANV